MIILKRIYKNTIVYIPGYKYLCLALRRFTKLNIEFFSRIPIPDDLIIPVIHDKFKIYLSRPGRCSIAKKYFWTNGKRHPLQDDLALNLFTYLSESSSLVLDIGANSGLFSIFAAKANANSKIFAFDILLESIHIFYDNIYLNKIQDRIKINLLGIGSKGLIKTPFDKYSSELPTAFSKNTKLKYKNVIEVNFVTLDSFLMPNHINEKVLIKIDVEGTEIDIFENSHDSLEKIRPTIICEVLTIGSKIDQYDQILKKYNYDKYLICENNLIKKEKIIADNTYKDWLFIPSEANI